MPTPEHSEQALARHLKAADRVLKAMRDGAVLHHQFARGGSHWSLTDGRKITTAVAELVVQSGSIEAQPDSLFAGGPPQTWKWWRDVR